MEEAAKGEEDSQISINPKDFKISPNTVGFFIAQSADEVKRWGFFFFNIMQWLMQGLVVLQGLPWESQEWDGNQEM